MSYMNTYIANEDIMKYGLDKIATHNFNVYPGSTTVWTLDREQGNYLIYVKDRSNPYWGYTRREMVFIFCWKNIPIEISVEISGGKNETIWELLGLSISFTYWFGVELNVQDKINMNRSEILQELSKAFSTRTIGSHSGGKVKFKNWK